mgnify:CR=1 FL=1
MVAKAEEVAPVDMRMKMEVAGAMAEPAVAVQPVALAEVAVATMVAAVIMDRLDQLDRQVPQGL